MLKAFKSLKSLKCLASYTVGCATQLILLLYLCVSPASVSRLPVSPSPNLLLYRDISVGLTRLPKCCNAWELGLVGWVEVGSVGIFLCCCSGVKRYEHIQTRQIFYNWCIRTFLHTFIHSTASRLNYCDTMWIDDTVISISNCVHCAASYAVRLPSADPSLFPPLSSLSSPLILSSLLHSHI